MTLPNNFADPFYNRIKNEVRAMLAGALGTVHFSEEGALARVRSALRAEHGYSDELVRSMPEWSARFADAPEVEEPQKFDTEKMEPVVQEVPQEPYKYHQEKEGK